MISNSIQLLVQDLDAACDPALTAMSKVTHRQTKAHFNLVQSGAYLAITPRRIAISAIWSRCYRLSLPPSLPLARFLPADAVAERGARRRPESLRDVHHHAHKAKRAHHQRQPGVHAEILHAVLHQVHQVLRAFFFFCADMLGASRRKLRLLNLPLLSPLSSFIPKFINYIFRCKPISMVGAEQVSGVWSVSRQLKTLS